MLNVPKFKKEFEDLLKNITENIINPTVLSPRIDQLGEMLATDVEWDKTCPRKNPSNSRGGPNMVDDVSFDETINGQIERQGLLSLKDWISIRSKNIISFFNLSSVESNQQAEEDYFGLMSYISKTGRYTAFGNQKVFGGLKDSIKQINDSILLLNFQCDNFIN